MSTDPAIDPHHPQHLAWWDGIRPEVEKAAEEMGWKLDREYTGDLGGEGYLTVRSDRRRIIMPMLLGSRAEWIVKHLRSRLADVP